MQSANRLKSSPRSDASIRRQGDPSLKASLAALTAFSTSACMQKNMREKQSENVIQYSMWMVMTDVKMIQASSRIFALSGHISSLAALLDIHCTKYRYPNEFISVPESLLSYAYYIIC